MTQKPLKITAKGLEGLRAELAALPPKPKADYSAREMVAEIEVIIRNALALGYDLQDIAEMVGQHGGQINPSTLSTYLRELATKSQGTTTKRKTKAGPLDATSTATLVSKVKPKSKQTGLGSTHAETNRDHQQAVAELDELLDQMSSTSAS
ncbi:MULTISPECIES: hypothetical protein [unclassified Yoonia]|uniref:hypothetical protein n=1 Tax=unclassified Yoonia TaxID=2629118 RepID=UPI002AFF7E90|nr:MULTISPECIES: hypothetical protein [unclassified Yoonia]